MNKYDLFLRLHHNRLDNIKQVFEEIAFISKGRIREINDAAQTMTQEDIENQLADDGYFYSETFSAINNNIYLAHVVSAVEIHLKRIKCVYNENNPSFMPTEKKTGSFLCKIEHYLKQTGCSYNFANQDWKDLDAFRTIRNSFIHAGAEYSEVEPVGQLYIDNHPAYFDVQTLLRRNGTIQKTTFYIKDEVMLINAVELVKRISDQITSEMKVCDTNQT